MAKKKKTQSQAGKQPGALSPKEGQEQAGRPTTERRQNEIPMRNDEEQQQPGDRFPRGSYEGGRENPKVF